MYTVHLTYFKPTGKYYSTGEYATTADHLYEVWEDVRGMLDRRELPGLQRGHSLYIVHVDVPDHPHRHPHLVIAGQSDEAPEVKPVPPKFEPPIITVDHNIHGVKWS